MNRNKKGLGAEKILAILVIAIGIGWVQTGTVYGAEQIVKIEANSSTSLSLGDDVSLSILYDVDDGNISLPGIRIGLFYDDRMLSFDGYSSFLDIGDVKTAPVISEDKEDIDNNPLTTHIVNMSWLSVDGGWPGINLPVLLAELKFLVRPDAEGAQTQINLVAIENSAGYKSETKELDFWVQ